MGAWYNVAPGSLARPVRRDVATVAPRSYPRGGMKNKVVTALACVGLVVAVGAALRVWEDHTAWGREELRRGYSQTARTLMPWFRQFLYTLVFLAGGASLSALFARGRRLAALKPWLAGAVLLFMIAGVAVTSTFRLRVLWVQRDPHAAFTQRQAPVTCQLTGFAGLYSFAMAGLLLLTLRRSARSADESGT